MSVHGRLPSYGRVEPMLSPRACPKCRAQLVRVAGVVMCFEGECDYEADRLVTSRFPVHTGPRAVPAPMADEGETRASYVLGYLRDYPWSGPNDVAATLRIAPQTASRVMAWLWGKGKVRRVGKRARPGFKYAIAGEVQPAPAVEAA